MTPPKAGPGSAGFQPARLCQARRRRERRGVCAPPGNVRGACDVRAGSPRSRAALARGCRKTPTPPKAGPGSAGFQAARSPKARRRVCAAFCAPPGNVRGACDVRAGSPRSRAALARGCRNAQTPPKAGPGTAGFQPARLRQARRRRVCAAVCAPARQCSRGLRRAGWKPALPGRAGARLPQRKPRRRRGPGARPSRPHVCVRRVVGAYARRFAPPPGDVRGGCDVRAGSPRSRAPPSAGLASRPHVCARRGAGGVGAAFCARPATFVRVATCGRDARAPGKRAAPCSPTSVTFATCGRGGTGPLPGRPGVSPARSRQARHWRRKRALPGGGRAIRAVSAGRR